MLLGVKSITVGSINYLYQEGAVSKQKLGQGKNVMLWKSYSHRRQKKLGIINNPNKNCAEYRKRKCSFRGEEREKEYIQQYINSGVETPYKEL